MARTPVARWLIDACSAAGEAATRQIPVEQVLHERAERHRSRRAFLRRTAGLGAASALAVGAWRPTTTSATTPRIVVVGAGLAGLTCAYRLSQAGYQPEVYEASDRIGGRCWTIRGVFAEAFRLLAPGGAMLMTDVPPYAQQDRLTAWRQDHNARFGGEPYWREAGHVEPVVRPAALRHQDVAAGGGGGVAARIHHQHVAGRAGLDRLALRVAAALEGAELVEVLARRDVTQRVGLADHPRRLAVQQEDALDEHVAEAALEEHRGQRGGGNFLESFAGFRGHGARMLSK